MFKNKLFHLSILLTLAIVIFLALTFASSAQSDMSMTDEIESVTIPFSETRTLYSEEIDQEFVISVALPYWESGNNGTESVLKQSFNVLRN